MFEYPLLKCVRKEHISTDISIVTSPSVTSIDELLQPRFLSTNRKPQISSNANEQQPLNRLAKRRREDLTSPCANVHYFQPSPGDHDYSHPTAVETHNIADVDEICPEKCTGYYGPIGNLPPTLQELCWRKRSTIQ